MLKSIETAPSLILAVGFIFVLSSCGGGGEEQLDNETAVNTKYAEGKKVYDRSCVACHMEDGNGLEGTFPPLAKSDYLLEDPARAVKQVLEGSSEEMKVNGVIYDGIMPPQDVTEKEAIAVVNYVLNAWGNDGGEVSEADLP